MPAPTMPTEVETNTATPRSMLSPVLRVSLLLGVCLHLVGFLVFRVVSNSLPERQETPPFVQYISEDTLSSTTALEEQAQLFDSAPLFIPTEWNASQNLSPITSARSMERFPSFEPFINLDDSLRPESLPLNQEYAVSKPDDLLALPFWNVFRGFGDVVESPLVFEQPEAIAELSALDGSPLGEWLVDTDLPLSPGLAPVSFMVRMEGHGRMLGRPALLEASGDSDFDAAAYAWIVAAENAARFPVGYFRIRIYPNP